jgi:hypothetical protein
MFLETADYTRLVPDWMSCSIQKPRNTDACQEGKKETTRFFSAFPFKKT